MLLLPTILLLVVWSPFCTLCDLSSSESNKVCRTEKATCAAVGDLQCKSLGHALGLCQRAFGLLLLLPQPWAAWVLVDKKDNVFVSCSATAGLQMLLQLPGERRVLWAFPLGLARQNLQLGYPVQPSAGLAPLK